MTTLTLKGVVCLEQSHNPKSVMPALVRKANQVMRTVIYAFLIGILSFLSVGTVLAATDEEYDAAPERGTQAKKQGNDELAIQCYTEAIGINLNAATD